MHCRLLSRVNTFDFLDEGLAKGNANIIGNDKGYPGFDIYKTNLISTDNCSKNLVHTCRSEHHELLYLLSGSVMGIITSHKLIKRRDRQITPTVGKPTELPCLIDYTTDDEGENKYDSWQEKEPRVA